MVTPDKIALKKQKQATSLNTLYFNRYLLIRYLSAFYVFSNMYWAFLLIGYHKITAIIPLTLFIASIFVVIEQVRKYWQRDSRLTYAKYFYFAQALVNLLGIGSYFTVFFNELFPFMSASGSVVMLIYLILGLLGCVLVERRISQIESNQDRALKIIREYESIIK